MRAHLAAVGLLVAASQSFAACPQSVCDCLGEARLYRIVARESVKAGTGTVREGFNFPIGTQIWDDVCGDTALLSEPASDYTDIFGDLYTLAGPGDVAVKGIVYGGDTDDAVGAASIATGGGSVIGPVVAFGVGNVIDTSGTHPGIPSCQQAIADMQAASQTLAALTPTQQLGDIRLSGGADMTINAGPGVNVFSAGTIALNPRVMGFDIDGAELFIDTDPGTEAVVINAARLRVGRYSAIVTDAAIKVIVNLVGTGPSVRLGADSHVAAAVLAPDRVLRHGTRADLRAVYARKVALAGTFVSQAYRQVVCPP